ncbi:MAG: UDP-N-acetylglucosamine 2-epimerase (non-hydrolyzing) [Patescibacteria group bacterium]
MKVLSLVGARPQFIQEAVLSKEFKLQGVEEILVHSGQHYDFDMADSFIQSLDITKPKYYLNVKATSHAETTGNTMIGFEQVALKEKPSVILVNGDTNTTIAGALVAAKLKIPLMHVESGIRMEPKTMPEEINRVVTDHISQYLTCPSKLTVANLRKEGITKGVNLVGDVMYDLFLNMKPKFELDFPKKMSLKNNQYVVATIHRDYNVDEKLPLKKILNELNKISKEIEIVFPLHPRTLNRIKEFGLSHLVKDLVITKPLTYFQLMGLTSNAYKIITDSGGYQKEAFYFGKQAIVVMPDTGWRELIGWNYLADPDNISSLIHKDPTKKPEKDVYGKGDAGRKAVNILVKRE